MRRAAILLSAAFLVLIALTEWRLHIKNYEYKFRNRAAVFPTGTYRLLTPQLPAIVVQNHDTVSEQSLLIRDPRVVDYAYFSCSTPRNCGPWSFPGVIRAAFQVGNAPGGTADSAYAAALKGQLDAVFPSMATTVDPVWTSGALLDAPFLLLAIVNRMDLAQVQNGMLTGAELRFEYEAVSKYQNDDNLRLIVEFVLKDMPPTQFQPLANTWMNLSNLSLDCPSPGSCYQDQLRDLIGQLIGQAKSVRVRANALAANVWQPGEFLFQGPSLVPHALEREPNQQAVQLDVCQDGTKPMGQFASQRNSDILQSTYQFDNWPSAGNQPLVCKVDDTDDSCPNDIGASSVLRLGTDLNLGAQLDEVRFTLSVNSCTACHFAETRTTSLHIGPRNPGQSSQLSGFLTGQPNCQMSSSPSGRTNPADAIPYCKVSTYANPSPLGKCAGTDPQSRSFNDLLRRHLYLYTVQTTPVSASAADWKKALDPFTAYQVD